MVQSRTHTCNDLRIEHVGQQVKLVGWMENIREVGQNLAFVVLRDFYGTTQIVLESEEMMAGARTVVLNALSQLGLSGYRDWNSIRTKLRDDLSAYIYARTRRRPMILPVLEEVNG